MFDIVVTNYEKPGILYRCLKSLLYTGVNPKEDRIFIVDNGSKEETVITYLNYLQRLEDERIRNNWIDVFSLTVIRNKTNLGCGKARNIGAEQGRNPFIVFLDNDVWVFEGWLESILKGFQDPSVGVVGLKALDQYGRVTGGGFVDKSQIERGRMWHAPDGGNLLEKDEKVLYVNGACFAVRRDVFEKLGGFDEQFWFWYEDSDFCLRAKRDLNLDTMFMGSFWIQHECNTTSSSRECLSHFEESREFFYDRWGEYLRSDNNFEKEERQEGI